jgi:hypothetical protein
VGVGLFVSLIRDNFPTTRHQKAFPFDFGFWAFSVRDGSLLFFHLFCHFRLFAAHRSISQLFAPNN